MIKIENKENCCGCSACAERCPKQCIRMKEDEQGFLYPSVDQSLCVDCGLCEKVCPVLNKKEPRRPIKTYAAKNTEEKIRMSSSSGGIFYALAEKVIKDGGVVFGARFNDSWEVVHNYSENIEELAAFQGSKYVQSDIGVSYRNAEKFLKQGRKVLFSGTPCQIAGLKMFLGKEYENLLTVDVICHGAPSRRVWREYLRCILRPKAEKGGNTVLQDISLENISHISFRDKTTGWREYSFVVQKRACLSSKENTVLRSSLLNDEIIFNETLHENLFMKGFLRSLYLRPSCYNCPVKCGKSDGDITLGDFWGIEKSHPDYDDDKGVSAILIYAVKGNKILSELSIDCINSSYKEIFMNNPAIENSAIRNQYVDIFWSKYSSDSIEAIGEVISLMQPNAIRRILSHIKQMIKK